MGKSFGSGRLTEADKERIHQLAERGIGAYRIAKDIGRHSATVQWFLYRHGYRATRAASTSRTYVRNGRLVRTFSAEEDAFIMALRTQGLGFTAIAERTNKRFGTQRGFHTIHCRLVMLAAREDAA